MKDKITDVKLRSAVLPLWMLFFVPLAWLVIIPGNFLVDSLALIISIIVLKLDNKKTFYKQNILKIFLLGIVSKILVTLGLFLMAYVLDLDANVSDLFLTIPALLIAGLMIFTFNYFLTFKNMDKKIRFKMALFMAIMTAPYIFILPITWY